MSQEEEIERLLKIASETSELKIVSQIIFNLAAYGPKSIPALNQIIIGQPDSEVRMYARETIRRIKQEGGPCLKLEHPL
jgi:hypothetical protein